MRGLACFPLIAVLSLTGAAQATCADWDQAALAVETDPLFAKLAEDPTEPEGRALAGRIWKIWSTAPEPAAQALLDKGVQSIGFGAFADAEIALTALIELCPGYAEGWNQRAFARFLNDDLEGALSDLDQTLVLEPRHFGALAGRGLTLLRQGRQILGFGALREAVALYPWMSERHLLPPDEKI